MSSPVPTPQDQPLSLAVHALPVPASAAPSNTAGRWKMMAVLLVCASPVIASYFTYYVIRPEGRRNFGELVVPQRPLPAVATLDLSGKPGELRALKKQWLLISVGSASCDTACQQRLYLQRQMRESLGKEKGRLDRIWLVSDAAEVDTRLKSGLAEATVLRVPADALAQWLPINDLECPSYSTPAVICRGRACLWQRLPRPCWPESEIGRAHV